MIDNNAPGGKRNGKSPIDSSAGKELNPAPGEPSVSATGQMRLKRETPVGRRRKNKILFHVNHSYLSGLIADIFRFSPFLFAKRTQAIFKTLSVNRIGIGSEFRFRRLSARK